MYGLGLAPRSLVAAATVAVAIAGCGGGSDHPVESLTPPPDRAGHTERQNGRWLAKEFGSCEKFAGQGGGENAHAHRYRNCANVVIQTDEAAGWHIKRTRGSPVSP